MNTGSRWFAGVNRLVACLLAGGLGLLASILPVLLEWHDGSRVRMAAGFQAADVGRCLLAEYSFHKAMDYFHSGALPEMFDEVSAADQALMREVHESKRALPEEHWINQAPEHGPPLDALDRFGRHFYPTRHTHLNDGGPNGQGENLVREILPWLWLAVELNPQHVESYLDAAYWLRRTEGKGYEAENFLRQGLRANPNCYEILFELGRIYEEDRADLARAGGLWEGALQKWQVRNRDEKQPDELALRQISTRLAYLEERRGNFELALSYLSHLKNRSKQEQPMEQWMDNLRKHKIVLRKDPRTEEPKALTP